MIFQLSWLNLALSWLIKINPSDLSVQLSVVLEINVFTVISWSCVNMLHYFNSPTLKHHRCIACMPTGNINTNCNVM